MVLLEGGKGAFVVRPRKREVAARCCSQTCKLCPASVTNTRSRVRIYARHSIIGCTDSPSFFLLQMLR